MVKPNKIEPDNLKACKACNAPILEGAAEQFPFCSERCRMQDLGKWFSGEYRLAGKEPVDPVDMNAEQDD